MPGCSVIVVTYNSGEHIESCVHALASQPCEIVVVDNASQDDTVQRLRELAPQIPVELITISRNIGFAAGVNHGVQAAHGDVLLVLNPDAIAEPHAVEAVLNCLQESGAAAIGGVLLEEDGQPARGFAFRRLPTLTSLLCEVLLVNQLWPRNPVNRRYRCLDANYAEAQEVEQPAGACLAVRRDAWERLQGMDSAFFPVWFEDVDFCARLIAEGGKIWYCPSARFRHGGAHSVGALSFVDKQTFWYSNMIRYAGKHFAAWKVVALRGGIVLGTALRSLASLLGGKPAGVSVATAVRVYAHVAAVALRPLRSK
jgi:N-acetylglucosaminyl-diphospho-decaprenol L-rhamnosyltransferase